MVVHGYYALSATFSPNLIVIYKEKAKNEFASILTDILSLILFTSQKIMPTN